jgi:hypothetical protein
MSGATLELSTLGVEYPSGGVPFGMEYPRGGVPQGVEHSE